MGTTHHNLWGSYLELAITKIMCGMETIQTISKQILEKNNYLQINIMIVDEDYL